MEPPRTDDDKCPLCDHRWHGLPCTWPTYPKSGQRVACDCPGVWAAKESA